MSRLQPGSRGRPWNFQPLRLLIALFLWQRISPPTPLAHVESDVTLFDALRQRDKSQFFLRARACESRGPLALPTQSSPGLLRRSVPD
jgi:hypothetical protein